MLNISTLALTQSLVRRQAFFAFSIAQRGLSSFWTGIRSLNLVLCLRCAVVQRVAFVAPCELGLRSSQSRCALATLGSRAQIPRGVATPPMRASLALQRDLSGHLSLCSPAHSRTGRAVSAGLHARPLGRPILPSIVGPHVCLNTKSLGRLQLNHSRAPKCVLNTKPLGRLQLSKSRTPSMCLIAKSLGRLQLNICQAPIVF